MPINDLISTIKTINGAVHIPAHDSWQLAPPNFVNPSQQTLTNKQLNCTKTAHAKSLIGPIIDSNSKTWEAINCAQDYRPEWGGEEKLGTESLAWYASFHRTNYWGIYIPYTGLLRFSSNFLDITQDPNLAIQLAWHGLISHEAMHYGIDVACAQIEVIANLPIYINGQAAMRSTQGHIPDEEQLAEAAMLRYFQSSKLSKYSLELNQKEKIFYRAVEKSAKLPTGYCDGFKCISPKIFSQHLNLYLNNLCHSGSPSHFTLSNNGLELSGLLPTVSTGYINPSMVNYSECPIHLFDDTPSNSAMSNAIHFITHVPHIEESPGFMNKVMPYLKQWIKTKELLGNPSYPKNNDNLDFKRWEDEDSPQNNTRAWSVRVGKTTNMRAHIDEHLLSKKWVATRFGNADKMGHHKNRK